MDGTCPNYEAGFDVYDPLGSVFEWSGRVPARVLRRRCRSEGVDRSPYEYVPVQRSADQKRNNNLNKSVPNKSHFTINTTQEPITSKYNSECSMPVTQNGDYIMANNRKQYQGYQQSGRPKAPRVNHNSPFPSVSPTRSKMDDSHLPKVEELFEKDLEMMEIQMTKQPLKSILNNPPLPLQGILKKPKNKSYDRSPDGRRRQRASSESDNLYPNSSSLSYGYDRVSSNLKRAKDNTGIGYTYNSAVASINPPKKTNPVKKKTKVYASVNKEEYHPNIHMLRTTAINNDTKEDDEIVPYLSSNVFHSSSPIEAETPAPLPPPPQVTKKLIKPLKKSVASAKNCKSRKMKIDEKIDEIGRSRSLSPAPDQWPALEEIEKHIVRSSPAAPPAVAAKAAPPAVVAKTAPPAVAAMTASLAVAAITAPPAVAAKTASPAVAAITSPPALPATRPVEKEKGHVPVALKPGFPPPAAPVKKAPSVGSSVNLPDSVANCLRPSLFPQVPPYLKFINHDEVPPLKVPLQIQKHLKWKLTSITPIVVKKTIVNSGFRLVKSECDTSECPQEETVNWVGIWGKHMKSIMFRAIKDGQKMNHFPGTFQIGRKDRLWRNLQKLMNKHGMKEFGIMPKTYVLPHDMRLLKMDWDERNDPAERWIIKPPASARGTGIKVISRWTQIPKKRSVVVQRYVHKPYLINGSKFDLRLYVLVTSIHPLRIYLYKDGLARFASVKYNDDITSLNDRYMHLTNYSINKLSKNYTPNEDFAACEGHKWTLQTLFQYLKNERKVDTKNLWETLKDLVVKTIIAGEASISSLTKANVVSRYNCYELFGVDVLLDDDLKPWLLEVNISPSLHSASPLDIHVKGPMVTQTLNIAQYQVPDKINLDMLTKEKPHKLEGLPYDSRLYTIYLSKEERDKHIIYTNMNERELYLRDILSTLTPDDVRHLIQAEDELTQSGDMERVFPTFNTHKYLEFLTGPRYYNRLFDAWEDRYGKNRVAGVELLRNLCEIGYHLEVPPVPLKNDVDAPSPIPSQQPSLHSNTSMERSPSLRSISSVQESGNSPPQPAQPPDPSAARCA